MISDNFVRKFYPGNKWNGTSAFYDWVRTTTTRNTRMLNLGAGPPTCEAIRVFKGEVLRVYGADIDPIVMQNSELDESALIVDGVLPYNNECFDVILSDYVCEHVEHPVQFISEVFRVLKPGGSFFFRTPNLYHYVALISAATPQWFHRLVANRARGLPKDAHEPWPTHYRMNAKVELARLCKGASFKSLELRYFEPVPRYLYFSAWAFMLGVLYERMVNNSSRLSGFRSNLFGRMVK